MAIATVRFKAHGNWKPSSITRRLCYLCPKYDESKVRWAAAEQAEAWAKNLEGQNEGLNMTYTVKVEPVRIHSVDVLDEEGNIVRPQQNGELQ